MEYQNQASVSKEPNIFFKLAHPGRFLSWSGVLLPYMFGLSMMTLLVGLYYAFFNSPADFQQGDTVRIMYIHVPSAYLGMACFGLMALSALGSLVWRHPMADVAMKAAAPIGMIFTGLALATGALWGQATWGTWWQWDGRMTSTLILFLMYLGIVALWRAVDVPQRAAKLVAILTLIGSLNLPVIHYSVQWWNSLHQGSSVLTGKIAEPFLIPLLIMLLGFTLFFVALHMLNMRAEIYCRRANAMQKRAMLGDNND